MNAGNKPKFDGVAILSLGVMAGGFIAAVYVGTSFINGQCGIEPNCTEASMPANWPTIAIAIAVGVPILALVISLFRHTGRVQSWEVSANEQREAASARQLAARTDHMVRAERYVVENSEGAVASFEALPKHIERANAASEIAARYYDDGAFSPFWSQIESAYGHIGQYRNDVQHIAAAANRHGPLVQALIEAGGTSTGLVGFPVQLDADRAKAMLDSATDDLGFMVYRAQKVPTFAQIWEQRRTTAAVVDGFDNLESAVNGMRSAVVGAISSLENSIETLRASTERSGLGLQGVVSELAASTDSASALQAQRMKELVHASNKIQGDIHHQTWTPYGSLRGGH